MHMTQAMTLAVSRSPLANDTAAEGIIAAPHIIIAADAIFMTYLLLFAISIPLKVYIIPFPVSSNMC